MKKFGNVIVHCKSEYEVNEFISLMAKEGYDVSNFKIGWEEYGKNVCFRFTLNYKNDIYYESKEYYEKYYNHTYEFLTFSEFYDRFYYKVIFPQEKKKENIYSVDMLKFLELLDIKLLPWQKEIIQVYMDRETFDKKETKTKTKTKYQIGDKVCIYDKSFSEFIIEGTVVNIYDNNRYGVRTSLFNELNCPECCIRNKKGEEEK